MKSSASICCRKDASMVGGLGICFSFGSQLNHRPFMWSIESAPSAARLKNDHEEILLRSRCGRYWPTPSFDRKSPTYRMACFVAEGGAVLEDEAPDASESAWS